MLFPVPIPGVVGMDLVVGRFEAGGARVGAAIHPDGRTGCTVVLLPQASPYAVHLGGGASSLRQVAAQVPGHSVQSADAFLLTGGSAYGLDAAGGVLRALEAMGRGTPVGRMRVPAVPAAALYDLAVTGTNRPDAALGEQAVRMAEAGGPIEGRVGAGAGATVGKALGIDRASPGGQAVVTAVLPEGTRVSALAVVNAFGSVRDPETGRFEAGPRAPDGRILDTEDLILQGAPPEMTGPGHTTLAAIVTDARLGREECLRAAWLASQALPFCIRPTWTAWDGDVVFLASCGEMSCSLHRVGLAARAALQEAILRAVRLAREDSRVVPGGRA